MKAIGGFFELEVPRPRESYHLEALPVTSGRAGLGLILDHVRPAKVHLPFYCCDVLLRPLRARAIPFSFYSLTETLDPVLPIAIGPAELVLYVDYFGLKWDAASELCRRFGEEAVIDLAQAFFRRPPDSVRAFNSARKWFGVPDGGYVFGIPARPLLPPNEAARWSHLVKRLMGRQEEAFREFRASEAAVEEGPLGPSPLAAVLLGGIDYSSVAEVRRHNFAAYAEALDPLNELHLGCAPDGVPFCYPFLPGRRIEHERLHERGVFVPRLWPELRHRPDSGYALERRLATEMIPLPIDHRLDIGDCSRVVELLHRFLE